MRLALIFMLCVAPCFGQGVVQLQGGASSFSGNGGGLVIYGPNSETHFSAGVINNHFAYSAAENFMFHDWEIGVGDNQFAITGGQFYLSAPVRGISLTRKRPYACRNDVRIPTARRVAIAGYTGKRCRGDSLYVFAGAVGSVVSSPFFYGIQQAHLGAGLGYKRELTRHFTVGTIQAWTRLKRTSLEEADFKTNHFEIKGQGGWLENNLQLSGNASAAWNHLGMNAGRSTYVFSTQQPGFVIPVSRITVNNFGVFGGYSHFSGSASVFQSNLNTGESLNLGARFGWFQVQASKYNSGKTSSKLLTITEHSMHWSLSQYITRSNGSTSVNFGAGYVSNRFTAQVGYNVLYFPLLPQAQAFQKVLSVTLGFRFKSTSLSATTVVNPQAKNQWQVGGDDYASTPLRMPAIPGASNDARRLPSRSHGGRYCFEFYVVDSDGNPIDGANLIVGQDSVFTNSQGRASSRQKHKTMPLRVDLDNFIAPEQFEIVDAPQTAEAGQPVKIIVKRKP